MTVMVVLADTGNRSTNTDPTFTGANIKYRVIHKFLRDF
jgi:hypothetical protein